MNTFFSSFSFSSSSNSHFIFFDTRTSKNSRFDSLFRTSRNSRFDSLSRTSRNSRFVFFILTISLIIKSRFSSSRLFNNILVDNSFNLNFLFTNSFLFFDYSFFFDFAFSFNFSRFSNRLSLSSNLRKKKKSNSNEVEKSNSKKETLNMRKERFAKTTQRFFVIDKTQDVLNYMRKLRFSLFDFFKKSSRLNLCKNIK
jgi:hypothetical protein